jgi:hypothetical protein
MAQRFEGGEWYTHLVFTENGETKNRRIHEIKVQGKDGWMYTLEGKDLPNFIQLDTGAGQKGKHFAEILLDPKNFPPPPKGKAKRWPNPRDAGHLVGGMTFALILLRVIWLLANGSRW